MGLLSVALSSPLSVAAATPQDDLNATMIRALAGDAERPMPDARGRLARRTEG